MPGPLCTPPVLLLYPFRFCDPVTGKWRMARYRAERTLIAACYAEGQLTGLPEYRQPSGAAFSPHR